MSKMLPVILVSKDRNRTGIGSKYDAKCFHLRIGEKLRFCRCSAVPCVVICLNDYLVRRDL